MYGYVLARLETTEATYAEIAKGSGVPLSTVTRIARQDTKDPSVHVIERLNRYFRQREHRKAS